MVKLVYSKSHFYHVTSSDLKSLSWLSVPDRVRFFKLVHVFKIRAGNAPDYLSIDFQPIAQSHTHNTRHSSHNYFVSRQVAMSPKSFAFSAIKEWNCLPEPLKSIESLQCFKKRLKEHIFVTYQSLWYLSPAILIMILSSVYVCEFIISLRMICFNSVMFLFSLFL